MQKTILIIENNPHLRNALENELKKNYPKTYSATTTDAINTVTSLNPQKIIVSDNITLKNIAKIIPNENIINLNNETTQNTNSLQKPFHINQLLKLLETQPKLYDPNITIDEMKFLPDEKKIITKNNQTIYLTDKETLLLKHLCQNKNKIVPRENLLKYIWGYENNMETHTLETHIYHLRKKLNLDAKILVNENGGYRLNA